MKTKPQRSLASLLIALLAFCGGSSFAAEMVKSLDIRYTNTPGVEAKSQSLDVYSPKDAKNAPVLIFIHGGGWLFFGIKRDSPVVERYLQSKDAGAPKEAQDLLGSDHYFDGKVVPAKDTTVVWHYKGDDPNPLRVPIGVDVVDRKMPLPAAGQ